MANRGLGKLRETLNLNGVLFEQSGYPWTVNICITSSWRLFFICSRNEVIMHENGKYLRFILYVTRAISSQEKKIARVTGP